MVVKMMDKIRFDNLKEAADSGDGFAIMELARCYHDGDGVKVDMQKAFKFIEKAVHIEYIPAYHLYGLMLIDGEGCIKDEMKGVEWVRKGAIENNSEAQCLLGRYYFEGAYGISKSYEKALLWFEKAYNLGSIEASVLIGIMHLEGDGICVDSQTAVKYFKEAVEKEDEEARYLLGMCMFDGNGIERNRVKGLRMIREAANSDVIPANVFLAKAYSGQKEGVEKDEEETFKWCKKAAELGDMESQYNLGRFYELGEGIKQDYEQAFNWLNKASEQGCLEAMNDLAAFYANGIYVKQNPRKAFELYKCAAIYEDIPEAVYNLGECYKVGFGTRKNLNEAKRLLSIAEKLGITDM